MAGGPDIKNVWLGLGESFTRGDTTVTREEGGFQVEAPGGMNGDTGTTHVEGFFGMGFASLDGPTEVYHFDPSPPPTPSE